MSIAESLDDLNVFNAKFNEGMERLDSLLSSDYKPKSIKNYLDRYKLEKSREERLLNCIYILLYDFDTKEHIIRGYTINGLFFAQNNSKKYIINQNDNEFLYVNNISFTKNSNILIGFYNSNKISLLSASELKPIWSEDLKYNGENDNKNKGTEWVEYSDSTREFAVLYRNEFQIFTLKNVKDQIFLDSN